MRRHLLATHLELLIDCLQCTFIQHGIATASMYLLNEVISTLFNKAEDKCLM